MLKKIFLSTLICTLLLINPITAKGDNVGFVDTETILSTLKSVSSFKAKIEEKGEKYKAKFENHQKKIEEAKQKGSSKKKLDALIAKMEKELKPLQEELSMAEFQFQEQLLRDIKYASKIVSKEYGIDVVIDKRAVFYGGFDLTDFVIKKIEELNN